MLYGALEAGGTKFVLGIGDDRGNLLERASIATRDPEKTMKTVTDFFAGFPVKSLGLGCFGPLELNEDSPRYGFITTTPKKQWVSYDILGTLKRQLGIPIAISTDVGAAALGEVTFGAFRSQEALLYMTIGTGIGGGYVINGHIHTGMLHPEIGHIQVNRHAADAHTSCCRYHENCLEGLASGPAVESRTGLPGAQVPDDHPVFPLIADYLAQALATCILVVSPTKIVLGGGVMERAFLFPLIRQSTLAHLNGYVETEALQDIDTYIVPPSLGKNAGIMGCLALAQKAALD
jgi:fructokinase